MTRTLRAPSGGAVSLDELKARIDLVQLVELESGIRLRRVGGEWRGLCPKHGGDSRTSFAVNPAKGLWHCWACDVGGSAIDLLVWLRGISVREAIDDLAQREGVALDPAAAAAPRPPRVTWKPPPPPRPELLESLWSYQDALPGSQGEAYLAERRIGLATAQRMGVGYAAPGQWCHRMADGRLVRDWVAGRIVCAHTDPDGNVVSLYGRAASTVPAAQRDLTHDHLAGPKALFNAEAISTGTGPLWVVEGLFDALALVEAGVERVVACFGLGYWRWDWAKEVDTIVLALDLDANQSGQAAAVDFARAARLRGKRVAMLPEEAYGGEKDVAAAWAKGVLDLGTEEIESPERAPATSSSTAPSAAAIDTDDNIVSGENFISTGNTVSSENFVDELEPVDGGIPIHVEERIIPPSALDVGLDRLAAGRRQFFDEDGLPRCTDCGGSAPRDGMHLCAGCRQARPALQGTGRP